MKVIKRNLWDRVGGCAAACPLGSGAGVRGADRADRHPDAQARRGRGHGGPHGAQSRGLARLRPRRREIGGVPALGYTDPQAVPATCAKCHSSGGYQDFLGVDGSEAGKVDKAPALNTVIDCVACHNPAPSTRPA